MVAVVLLVMLTIAMHGLLHGLSWWVQPLLDGSWALWALLFLGLWLFAGAERQR